MPYYRCNIPHRTALYRTVSCRTIPHTTQINVPYSTTPYSTSFKQSIATTCGKQVQPSLHGEPYHTEHHTAQSASLVKYSKCPDPTILQIRIPHRRAPYLLRTHLAVQSHDLRQTVEAISAQRTIPSCTTSYTWYNTSKCPFRSVPYRTVPYRTVP